jgi:uncharacterized protein (DUF3820 family)
MAFGVKLNSTSLKGAELAVVVSGALSAYYTLWNESGHDVDGPRAEFLCNLSKDHDEAMAKAHAIAAEAKADSVIECDRQAINQSATAIPFGKHKGKAFWDVDASYVAWMYRSTDLNIKNPKLYVNIGALLANAIEVYDDAVEATKNERDFLGELKEEITVTLTDFKLESFKDTSGTFTTWSYVIKAKVDNNTVKFMIEPKYHTSTDLMNDIIVDAAKSNTAIEVTATVKYQGEYEGWKWTEVKNVKPTILTEEIKAELQLDDEREAILKAEKAEDKAKLALVRKTWKLPVHELTTAPEGMEFFYYEGGPAHTVKTHDVINDLEIKTVVSQKGYNDYKTVIVTLKGEKINNLGTGGVWKPIKKELLKRLVSMV